MRALVIAVVLAGGCADDRAGDPHAIVQCQSDWYPPYQVIRCAAACEYKPPDGVVTCFVGAQSCRAVVFGEHRGCCNAGEVGGEITVLFMPCDE